MAVLSAVLSREPVATPRGRRDANGGFGNGVKRTGRKFQIRSAVLVAGVHDGGSLAGND
jgi:hypothetical protein